MVLPRRNRWPLARQPRQTPAGQCETIPDLTESDLRAAITCALRQTLPLQSPKEPRRRSQLSTCGVRRDDVVLLGIYPTILPILAHGIRATVFPAVQQIPLRLRCDPMHETRTARARRISGKLVGDEL